MAHHSPDILSHEKSLGLAKHSLHKWREFKHRRASKCAENHKFAESKYGQFLKLIYLHFVPACPLRLNGCVFEATIALTFRSALQLGVIAVAFFLLSLSSSFGIFSRRLIRTHEGWDLAH